MTDPELKRKGFSLFKKAAEITYPCIRLSSAEDGLYESLSVSAFSDLSGLFGCISEQIFAKFGSIGQELDFYCVVLKYIKALSEKKVARADITQFLNLIIVRVDGSRQEAKVEITEAVRRYICARLEQCRYLLKQVYLFRASMRKSHCFRKLQRSFQRQKRNPMKATMQVDLSRRFASFPQWSIT